MKTLFLKPIVLSLLLVLFTSSCSKSEKKPDTGSTDDAAITGNDKKLGSSNAANTDPYSCKRFYQYLSDMTAIHLEEKTVGSIDRLKAVVTAFVGGLKNASINVDDYNEDNIKDNDCTEIEKIAGKLKGNKNLMEQFGETAEEFDPLAYTYENILYIFANSMDHFSSFFGAHYISFFGFEGSVNTGLRFLSRSDYYDVDDEEGKLIKKGRSPEYLYVEETPEYLKAAIPKYTKIYNIGDKAVKEMPIFESLGRMSRKGQVTLTVILPNESEKKTITVKLISSDPSDTSFKMVSQNPNIGYLKVTTFNKEDLDSDLFKTWIGYLLSDTPAKLDGTIIDLRTNGGGRVDVMQKIAGTILSDPNTIISHRVVKINDDYQVTNEKSLNAFPLMNYGKIIVLTDFMTASASEMLVAALQDYNAAVAVGESTIGKGIGQRGLPINSDHIRGDAHITNFYMASPSGRSWYFDGIQPDIEVKEKSHDGYYWKLGDRKKSLPPALSKQFDYEFDPNVEVRNKISNTDLVKLKAIRNDATQEPAECKKAPGELAEEESCIYAWGLTLLKSWIAFPTQ